MFGWYVRLWLQEQASKAVFGHEMAKKGAVLLTSISTEVVVGWISFAILA